VYSPASASTGKKSVRPRSVRRPADETSVTCAPAGFDDTATYPTSAFFTLLKRSTILGETLSFVRA